MSEYIVNLNGELGMALAFACAGAGFVREELARCRDCKHYRFKDRSHIFNDDRHNDSYCLRFVDGKRMEVEPDGFCAWGERRQSDER